MWFYYIIICELGARGILLSYLEGGLEAAKLCSGVSAL